MNESWKRALAAGGSSLMLLSGCQLPAGAPEAGSAPGQANKVVSARDIGPKATLLPKATPRPEQADETDEERRAEDPASDAQASAETTASEASNEGTSPASTEFGAPTVTFLAGEGTVGHQDGTGEAAKFYGVRSITVDPAGDLYVLDKHGSWSHHLIRHVSPAGEVKTIAGKVGSAQARVDGVGAEAEFLSPVSLALCPNGLIAISELPVGVPVNRPEDGAIRFLDPSSGEVTTRLIFDEEDRIVAPGLGLAVDANNELLITPVSTNTTAAGLSVRRIAADGRTTLVAGIENNSGSYVDGPIDQARFRGPDYLAVAEDGRILVADENRVRVITPGEKVSTLAGSERGFKDGSGGAAAFTFLRDITVDAAGNAYVIDQADGATHLRMITPAGQVRTLKFESPLLQNITAVEASTKGVLYVFSDGKLSKVELAL